MEETAQGLDRLGGPAADPLKRLVDAGRRRPSLFVRRSGTLRVSGRGAAVGIDRRCRVALSAAGDALAVGPFS